MAGDQNHPLESVDPSRRSFIKKMVAITFAAPVITTFGMESLATAGTQGKPNQTLPNQPRHRDDDHEDRRPKPPPRRGRERDD